VSDSAPVTGQPPQTDPSGSRRRVWLALVGLAGVLVLAAVGAATLLAPPQPSPKPPLELIPHSELDRRWGTYLSEREWGTPREAINGNGWGLSWRGAIDREYRYSDDGIAGITDLDNVFRIGWAFWDGRQDHVSERFLGATNPQAAAGEEILDDRVFLENTPTHAYSRLVYRYPAGEPVFEIELESAKLDSNVMVLSASATNLTASSRELHVVLKGWMAPGGATQPLSTIDSSTGETIADGLLLNGDESVVAIVGRPPDSWQVSAEKGALDQHLRAGRLTGDSDGHIGALAYHLELTGNETRAIRIAFAESEAAAPSIAEQAAREALQQSLMLLNARRTETRSLFRDVSAYEDMYRQALSSLLWSQSYYRWDGATSVDQRWGGLVDARDVLIMPDKWEFPWPASWDQAFHAVTATLVDVEIAKDQLRFLLSDRWQQPNGHVPCAEWVMAEECPPIFAWAAWRVFEASRDRDFLAEIYPALQRHYDYWWQNHLVDDGLFTGGFLGMDNLPRSVNRAQADASAWMAFFARDMARIASELRDPATSERYWVDRGRIQEAINEQLWNDDTGFYHDLAAGGRFMRQQSYSGLVPLIAGVVPPERLPPILDALRDEQRFLGPGGIRSLSADSPLYTPGMAGPGVNSNWRGPIWIPINYLLIHALQDIDPRLAGDVRDRLLNMVEADWRATGRFHEFFDGDTGEGLGADSQTGWTALVANLIAERWPAPPPAP
jgi:hypothetical protein